MSIFIPTDEGEPPRKDVAKPRQCLRCRATFESSWIGERICARCKNSTAWRKGVPAPFNPVTRRRS